MCEILIKLDLRNSVEKRSLKFIKSLTILKQ